MTQLPAVPSHGEFPNWFPRKYRPASGRRRGRPSARARPFFRRIDPTESRFETCTTRPRGVRRSRVKLRRTTGLYPTPRDPPATPRVSNVRPSDVPANIRLTLFPLPRSVKRSRTHRCHRDRASAARRGQGETPADAIHRAAPSRAASRSRHTTIPPGHFQPSGTQKTLNPEGTFLPAG